MGEAHYVLGLVQRDLDQAAGRAQVAGRSRAPLAGQSDVGARSAGGGLSAGRRSRAAINQLEALAALDPARADRVVAVGLAQARAGREDAAVVTLGRAVERFPDAPQVYAALGHVWLTDAAAPRRSRRAQQGGRSAAAGGAADRMRPARPSPSSAARGLLAGDRQAAERALRQAVAKLPVPPDAYLQLADVTARDGRIQDARDALLKYATLVGDEQPLATVATQIADYSVRLGEPRARRALVRSRDR